MVPHFRFILTLRAVQTSRDRMATKADRDYLTLLAGRILETESARANALHEFRRLDDLLTMMQTNFSKLANRAAPVYSIPNEILSAIFKAACFPRSLWPLDIFEIKFSHVTHHWRDVAVNTPHLWTEIKVFRMKNSLDMVEAYLTRSKWLPLDMKVYLTIRSQSTPSVIQAICSHAGRWRRLSAICSQRDLLSLLFRSLHSHSAPLLELVDINAGKLEENVDPEEASVYDGEDAWNEDANDRFREILTGGSPLLTTIKLCGLRLHDDMPALRMVTTLHIYAPKTPLLCTECCATY
jgi:hypothetical protein